MPQSEREPHEPQVVYRYIGNASIGEGHMGIPARDLTDEDVAALPKGTDALLAISRIYEAVEPEPAPAKKASKAADKPADKPAE